MGKECSRSSGAAGGTRVLPALPANYTKKTKVGLKSEIEMVFGCCSIILLKEGAVDGVGKNTIISIEHQQSEERQHGYSCGARVL